MKSPKKWQWVPFWIAVVCLPGLVITFFQHHWIQEYGLVKAILMQLSTPEFWAVFPPLAIWYCFLALWYYLDTPPDDPNDKKPPKDTAEL
jgi:hypothetical protein